MSPGATCVLLENTRHHRVLGISCARTEDFFRGILVPHVFSLYALRVTRKHFETVAHTHIRVILRWYGFSLFFFFFFFTNSHYAHEHRLYGRMEINSRWRNYCFRVIKKNPIARCREREAEIDFLTLTKRCLHFVLYTGWYIYTHNIILIPAYKCRVTRQFMSTRHPFV